MDIDLFLASASPRRKSLLERIGVRFHVLAQDIDEQPNEDEAPEVFAIRLALEKARAGLAARPKGQYAPVLGADTVVAVDESLLGKPKDKAEGLAMLERLSGRSHRVLTGVALVDGDRESTRLSISYVQFRPIEHAEAVRYWETGEPLGKAGGYAIQGLGGVFAEQLEGSYTGVMGLPLFETHDLLSEFEIDYQSHWPIGQ
ncbi:septum formation inhibitor Maf [Spiribacter sp. C176]|uniref:dTTP/UTP pyrophosphatase n=1 Tax=Spiribacter salilacus TaxID=2664894 RepID=A0A6N7QT74_9GAMM|nr:Maf family protein [Spiribacter salilacus]MRH78593.1 septum formation inhibitor Maf [Spiribacter salilacus]